MNRYDKKIAITPEKVGESLHHPIVCTIPFEEKTVINSINRGVPFIYENKTFPVSKSILDLAALVQKKAPENEMASTKGPNGKK